MKVCVIYNKLYLKYFYWVNFEEVKSISKFNTFHIYNFHIYNTIYEKNVWLKSTSNKWYTFTINFNIYIL